MLTPLQVALVAAFVGIALCAVGAVALRIDERRYARRAARRPPFDGARQAGPGAVPPAPATPRPASDEPPAEYPPITDSLLVRPYVLGGTRPIPTVPGTAPDTLPDGVRSINGSEIR